MIMILVRDVFRLRFGKAKEAQALLKEGMKISKKAGFSPQRQLVDLTGPFYTLVLESTHESLAAWEKAMGETGQAEGAKEWGAWYERFKPLVESGHREIFTVLDGK
jgi:hypothetical protein